MVNYRCLPPYKTSAGIAMRDQRRASLASAALGSETLSKRERQFVAFCLQQATNANAFSVKFELKGKRLGASI